MDLEIVLENALAAADQLQAGLRGQLTGLQRQTLLARLSERLRIAAIATLLSEADRPAFQGLLARSAEARRSLLLVPPEAESVSRFRCSSRVGPLFDAVVSGRRELALEIAALSPTHWLRGEEFEDDFAVAQALHAWLLSEAGRPADLPRALEQLERVVTPSSEPRLKLLVALADRRDLAFQQSLEQLVLQRAAELREEEEGLLADPEQHATECGVFVEGLAWWGLAEGRGLQVTAVHPLLPRLARSVASAPPGQPRS